MNIDKKAFDAFPVSIQFDGHLRDINLVPRYAYKQGYLQAAEDFKMTRDDVLLIRSLINARKSNKEIARIYNDRTNLDNPSEVVLFRRRSEKD